jgi:hypothetical protein
MGQYYKIVNIKKKQYITPHRFGDGAKLMEFAMSANGVLAGLAILLADGNGRGGGDLNSDNEIVGSWAGDNIVVAGDYADLGKFVKDQDRNLYDIAVIEGKDISLQVLEALFDDQYFFDEFRKHNWVSDIEIQGLIDATMKKRGLSNPITYSIPSSKDVSINYIVTNDNGDYTCDCPSFTYTGGKECKHIREVKSKQVVNV